MTQSDAQQPAATEVRCIDCQSTDVQKDSANCPCCYDLLYYCYCRACGEMFLYEVNGGSTSRVEQIIE